MKHIHAVRIPFNIRPDLGEAGYYGYRFGLVIGFWLVFFGKLKQKS